MPIRADVRIIAATHRDLNKQVKAGHFREDLFYRLNVVPIRLPPLRDRTEDIPELVEHFFARGAESGLPFKVIHPTAMDVLMRNSWPGNVRELENLVQRLAALYSDETITADIVREELSEAAVNSSRVAAGDEDQTLSSAIEGHLVRIFAKSEGGRPENGLYNRVLQEMERPLIRQTLASTRGNQIKAAEILGLNRNTLRKKIRELDIEVFRGPV